jgi:hypothetical protein
MSEYNNDPVTPGQWRTIRSRRGKTTLAAKALWDVVLGLEPDGRTDRGDYIKFYRIAQTALRHFRDGTTPTYDERRRRTYREYEAVLSALGEIALETARAAYMVRSREVKTARVAAQAAAPKKQSKTHKSGPQAVAPEPTAMPTRTESEEGPRGGGPSVAARTHRGCALCSEHVGPSEKFCKQCREGLDTYYKLLGDGVPRTVSEMIEALDGEYDEDGVTRDLRSASRFIEKDGKWTLRLSLTKPVTGIVDDLFAEWAKEVAEASKKPPAA